MFRFVQYEKGYQMRILSRQMIEISDQNFFYIEQWAALLLGTVLLGVSIWSMFHMPPSPSVPGRPWLVKAIVFLNLHWLLVLAANLMAFCLCRFAFHARFKKPNGDVTPAESTNAPRKAKAKATNRFENVQGRS